MRAGKGSLHSASALGERRGRPARRCGNSLLTLALLALAIFAAIQFSSPTAARARAQLDLSSEPDYLNPIALKLSPDGRRLYVVCEGSDSLLAVDVAGRKVVAKASVGQHPKGLAISPDGKTLYVSNEESDTVSEIDAASFEPRRTFQTGWGPVGLTTDRSGKTLYVANSIGNDVSLIDLSTGKETKRLGAWRSPHQVALSHDGRRVYVSNLLPHLGPYDQPPVSELTAIDAERQIIAERILIPGVIELGHIAESPARDGGYLLIPFLRPKNLGPLVRVQQGWVVTHGMAIIRPAGASASGSGETSVTEVLLDDIDYFFADNYGAAITPNGRLALVGASGANVVSVIDTDKMRKRLSEFPPEELADRLDSAQEFVLRRLPTDHDPRSIVVTPDSRLAFIANRLADNLTVIDLGELRVAGTIDLGGPKEITLRRRGERLFHDASYCYQGQFACATCHPSDHVDGLAWNLETPRLGRDRVDNRTLRGIAETAPYKWNGHNPDLITQCGPRIAKFLFRSEGFNTEELQSLVVFLRSIPLPWNRHLTRDGELTEAQERGRRLFFRTTTNDGQVIPIQNRCDTCHTPATHYTNRLSADVGSGTKYDTITLFDVPQLDRVYESAPYLHDGEARTLEEIWTVFNNQNTHGYTSDMRKEQLNDLIEYLKTL
jgi:YVTN family beta-propeller protein